MVTDSEWCEQMREDYPDKAEWSDDELRDYFDEGSKYSTTWDHIGDAYNQYEPLADSYLEILAALEDARQFIVNGVELGYIRMPDPETPDSAHQTLPNIEAAIAKALGK